MRIIAATSRWLATGALICAIGLGAVPAGAETRNWSQTAAGTFDWENNAHWFFLTYPNAQDDVADTAIDIAGPQTITLNQEITLGTLLFGDTVGQSGDQNFQAGATGSLTFAVSSGTALLQKKNGNSARATTISANIRLADTLVVDNSELSNAWNLTLSGAISGDGGLIKTNASPVIMAGATLNTYTGGTRVAGGVLVLDKNNQVVAIPGDVSIASGASLRLASHGNITNAAVVTIEGNGRLQMGHTGIAYAGSYSDTIAGLTSDSPDSFLENTATSGGSTLTVNDAQDRTFAGTLRNGAAGTLAIVKQGAGTWTLSGNGIHTGATTIEGGALWVNGTFGASAVSVSGGALGGTGVVSGMVTVVSGSLTPGASVGALTLAGGLTMNAGDYR